MVRCVTYSHELCMTLTFELNIKIIFSHWIWIWQDVFALWHWHTKFLHMGVSPWDMCTFLTLVWIWPLTYMWVAGGSLVSFTHSFYLYKFINVCHMLMSRGKRIDNITSYRFINVCHMLVSRGKRIDNITSYRFINVCHTLNIFRETIDNITSYRFINVCHTLMSIGKRIDNIISYRFINVCHMLKSRTD